MTKLLLLNPTQKVKVDLKDIIQKPTKIKKKIDIFGLLSMIYEEFVSERKVISDECYLVFLLYVVKNCICSP